MSQDSAQPQQPHQPDRNLAEISHLFLSAVRDKAGGPARPQRTPPPKTPAVSIDLTPEEFAQVAAAGDENESASPAAPGSAPVPPVTAIIGGHLNGKQFDRAHIKRAAWVLSENLSKTLYDSVRSFSAREFPVFATREEALDYLVS